MGHTVLSVVKLESALASVDWASNVATFLLDGDDKQRLSACNLRLAVWARQFEQADNGNPALSFVREMQSSSQMGVALIGLALYKPAASSIRTVVETALYYTYFRSHEAELATLVRDRSYYVSKAQVVDFHKTHTPSFKAFQEKLGLLARLDDCYSSLSAVVHGQIPGTWSGYPALRDIAVVGSTQKQAVTAFVEAEEVVHRLFLCVLAPVFWDDFSSSAKKPLLKGLSGDIKTLLKLDER